MIADWRRLFWIGSTLVLIAGCQSQPPYPSADLEFTTGGKLGFKSAQRGQSVRFSWLQYTDGYEIEVWGPLGQGRLRLAGNFERMAVYRGDEILRTASVAEVMQETLGWSIPIEVLRSWIQGVPHPAHPVESIHRTDDSLYSAFRQLNWDVNLSKFKALPLQARSGSTSGSVDESEGEGILDETANSREVVHNPGSPVSLLGKSASEPEYLATPRKIVATSVNLASQIRVTVVIGEFLPAPGFRG